MKKRNLSLVLALATILTTVSVPQKTFAFTDKVSNALSEIGNENGNGENNGNNLNGGEQVASPTSNIQSKDLIISSVTTDEDIVEPGMTFTLTFKVENISGNSLYGVSLKIVNVEGKGTLDGFMPVGTTNEIYVGSIARNDVKYISITLASDPNIKAGVHNFVTSVMFNEKGKEQEEITKIVGIMVQNTPSISISGVTPSEGTISAALRNDSKTKIKNVKAKVTIGTEVIEQNIGGIDVEGEEYMDIAITPAEEERDASIEITYEDTTGKQYTETTSCKVPAMMIVNEEPQKRGKLGLISFIKSLFRF